MIESKMQYLEKYNKMKFAIQECHKVDEVKLIRDKAEAYRYALIQAKESPEYIRMAEEIKVRAERKAGELLPEQITIGTKSHPMTLSDMEISKNQSSNWQWIASIPKEIFENYIQSSEEITTSGTVNLAKRLQRENEINEIKKNISNININGLYDVIVVDPPWKYTTEYNPYTRRISSPYPEMNLQEIKDIDIPAKDN
ncbi:unnamed protein product, partial [marine sediment metagenome]